MYHTWYKYLVCYKHTLRSNWKMSRVEVTHGSCSASTSVVASSTYYKCRNEYGLNHGERVVVLKPQHVSKTTQPVVAWFVVIYDTSSYQ